MVTKWLSKFPFSLQGFFKGIVSALSNFWINRRPTIVIVGHKGSFPGKNEGQNKNSVPRNQEFYKNTTTAISETEGLQDNETEE